MGMDMPSGTALRHRGLSRIPAASLALSIRLTNPRHYGAIGGNDIKANSELVRSISGQKPLWLYIDWENEPPPETLTAWTNAFAGAVHGFFVQHSHEWDVEKHPVCASAGAPLLALGKPVIRAGFRYVSARSRPGIEADLAENYRQRIGIYEKWIGSSGFAGFSRDTGGTIPEKSNANLDFIETRQTGSGGTNEN